MKLRTCLMTLSIAASAAACDSTLDPTPSGDVNIVIQQALTGQTTSAGTFTLTGALSDEGQTTEELTFGGVLTQPVVPVTFRRVITGKRGTLTVTGAATLTWTSQTGATLAGTWEVESATGAYSSGNGTLTGNANFAATPPTASLTYVGVINR
jgi:hypothetical protein